ncbi:MAG TPA: ADP-ribosylglycohydrolase family protein [Candidatus Limnocylindrales bacterium]|nr:ADP-ribosylglycohydrolase family protein [Candidatus Limnocylindrales bacterium]
MSERVSHFEGCLLGVMIGDSLGSRVENASAAMIRHRRRDDRGIHALRPGLYGSTTEMTLALAESLAAEPDFDGDDFARRLVARHHEARVYGQGTAAAIARLRAGLDWREVGTGHGRGCAGNAAATRSAPIGLMFGHDVERLRWVAEEAAAVTHTHAFGVEGAVVFALGVAAALSARGDALEPADFLDAILTEVHTREYRTHLETAQSIVQRSWEPAVVVGRLGNNQTALGSVVTALACFASHSGSFTEAVSAAVALGGNATSIVAMTAALAGAFHGIEDVPVPWIDALERAQIDAQAMLRAARALEALAR